MDPQVLLVASSAESNVAAWDISTGTQLTSYKGNASPVNGVSVLGRDYLIATQLSKGAVHIWAWHKDQVHLRSFAVEPLTAVAATPDGLFCAAGGASGSIHIWEVSSGRLLRSWPAHYKAVTALAFNDSASILVSGGEDTLVNAWLLAEVLGTSGSSCLGSSTQLPGGASALQPLHSWSDHTLPVTSLAVGAGDANAVVVSGSLDRCVKVRSLVQGGLLLSVAFPAAIHSVGLAPGEHALYAGSATGSIYELSLVGEDSSDLHPHPGGSGGGPASATAHNGGGSDARWHAMEGHSRAVTCLSFTGDAACLVSGSEDQSVRMWDLRSRQQVRVLANPAKGPVTAVLVIDRPPFIQVGGSHAVSSSSQGTSTKKGPKRPQPLAPFAKYANAAGVLRPWEGGLVIIDGSTCAPDDAELAVGHDDGSAMPGNVASLHGGSGGWDGEGGCPRRLAVVGAANAADERQKSGQDVQSLREENERLQQQLERALQTAQQWGQVNAQLQQLCSEMLTQT